MAAKTADIPKRRKVIILGAGIAGLSVAKHFVKNNMLDFIILEAKNCIGGRVHSEQKCELVSSRFVITISHRFHAIPYSM